MNIIYLALMMCCLMCSCEESNSNVKGSALAEPKIYNELLFRDTIRFQKQKLEVLVFDLKTKNHHKHLLIRLCKNGEIVFLDSLLIDMNEKPIIQLKDIDGDEIDDLVVEFLRPGRGGNNVSMIYLFDKNKLRLNRISNSINFPNLAYDQKLNFTSSFRFYGGNAVQMDFLKVVEDTLLSQYQVIKEAQNVHLEKYEGGK